MDNFVMSFQIAKEVMSLKSKRLIVNLGMNRLMKCGLKSINAWDIGQVIFPENTLGL